MIVRQPAVAGMFYPAEKDTLRKKLRELFDCASTPPAAGEKFKIDRTVTVTPKILVVPHAGIEYSGRVAAAGFNLLQGKDIRRVILLGASHRRWFDYAAVYNRGKWQTPLGGIKIDQQWADKITHVHYFVKDKDLDAHGDEHSLEVELIFLQEVLKNFRIVPILVSEVSEKLADAVAKKIAQNFDDQTLLIISSDLSHYPLYEVANEADKKTIEGILTGKAEKFEEAIRQVESFGYLGLETAACGHRAIEIGLKVGEILGIKDYQLVKYENSGDVSSDKSGVVGYAAIIGNKKQRTSNKKLVISNR